MSFHCEEPLCQLSASEPSVEVPSCHMICAGLPVPRGVASRVGLKKGWLVHSFSQYLPRASYTRTQGKQDTQSPAPRADTPVGREVHKHLVEDQGECKAREGLLTTGAWAVPEGVTSELRPKRGVDVNCLRARSWKSHLRWKMDATIHRRRFSIIQVRFTTNCHSKQRWEMRRLSLQRHTHSL